MTMITRFSVAIAPMLLVACVSGTDVFQVPPDAGPIECERPESGPPVHIGFVTTGADLGDALRGLCVPPLEVSTEGLVDCRLLETLPSAGPNTDCDALPGRTHVRDDVDEMGALRQVCELSQLGGASAAGWRYDRASEFGPESEIATNCLRDGQRLTFVGFELGENTVLEWVCAVSDLHYGSGLGAACGTSEAWIGCGYVRLSADERVWLACDSVTDRCVVPCTTDAECADAGLIGEVCAERGVCVIPGCFAP